MRGACDREKALEHGMSWRFQGGEQRRWPAFSRFQKRLTVQGETVAGPTRVESHFRNAFEKFGVANQLTRCDPGNPKSVKGRAGGMGGRQAGGKILEPTVRVLADQRR